MNEYGAEVVKDAPDRFGHFAGIPLPDVDAAVAEAVHALDTLHADGVVLMSTPAAAISVTPTSKRCGPSSTAGVRTSSSTRPSPRWPCSRAPPAPLADYVFDTTRSALNLVLNGVMHRNPNVRVILSHGGGFLPYAAYRFTGLTSTVVDRERKAEDILRDLKRFYFDTALSASPSALPALLAFAEPGHILYGSDWPFAPHEAGSYYNHYLETYPDFAPGQADAINRKSAEILFPRLAR